MIIRRARLHIRSSKSLIRTFLLAALILLAFDTHWLLFCVPSHPPLNPADAISHPETKDRIFIAAIHWNSEKILRSHWNNALVGLVERLGPQNVYVSILESGSWDKTKDALRELDSELERRGVEHNIVLENVTHKDELAKVPSVNEDGFVFSANGTRYVRRIPYLSRLRNRAMSDISEVARQNGRPFDKVLWLNDVVFKVRFRVCP